LEARMDERSILDEITRRTLATFPRTQKIVLFGSRAVGTAGVDSDYDLLVVVPSELKPARRGARLRLALRGIKASFDLVVVTPEEYRELVTWKSSIVSQASRTGRILHEAA
jgi:predicted nucleotidyltransferase